MSGVFREVSKQHPCPICGKTDWCCTAPASDGFGDLYLCKNGVNRQKDGSDVLSPYTGGFYVCLGLSDSMQSYCYRLADDLVAAGKYAEGNGSINAGVVYQKKVEVDVATELSHKELDKVYRKLLSLLALEKWHKDYLVQEGWNDEIIAKYLVKSLPENDFMRWKKKEYFKKNKMSSPRMSYQKSRKSITAEIMAECGSVEGVPGFYLKTSDKGDYWTFNGRSGIVFPLFDKDGYIFRLRIRLDYEDCSSEILVDGNGRYYMAKPEGCNYEAKHYFNMSGVKYLDYNLNLNKVKMPKYNNMTSFKCKDESDPEYIVNFYKNGCSAGNNIGLYCDENTQFGLAHIDEGEKKAILSTYKMRVPNICIPGVSSIKKLNLGDGKDILDFLKSQGVKFIAVMFDMDKYENAEVSACEKQAVEIIIKNGFEALIGEWDTAYKGLDDALNAHCKISYISARDVYPELYK